MMASQIDMTLLVPKFLIFSLLIGVFAGSGVLAYSNPSSSWQANQPTFDKLYAGDFENYWPILSDMKDGQCNATTDFVIGIPPGGCSPSVVRSDLLAEQNVPVFCQLYAIKVNPLIKVSSIKSISFKGDYPEGVRSIVYHPARAAVKSYSTLLGSPTLENIGYVVIILKQEKVEANITAEIFGNLTATMTYDAEEAYGTGKGDYYLEPMNDEQWDSDFEASSFWNGRGYLRVSDISDGSAKVQIMGSKDKILRTLTLKEGETSTSSYLPGFYCKAGLKVKLTDITTPEDMAKLNVDGQSIWVRDGSKFLDGKCQVRDLDVRGNNDGEISISCSGAGTIKELSLKGSVIELREGKESDGAIRSYNLGDRYGEKGEIDLGSSYSKEDKYIVAYGKLDESEDEFVVLADKMLNSDLLKKISGFKESAKDFEDFKKNVESLKDASNVKVFSSTEDWFVRLGTEDKESEPKINPYFTESVDVVEKELVADYGREEKEIGGTWAEEALFEEIKLAGELGQMETKKGLMDLFLDKYPLSEMENYVRDMRSKMDVTDYSESYASVYVGDEFKSISVVDFKIAEEGSKRVDLKIGSQSRNNLSEENDSIKMGGKKELEIQSILPGKIKVSFKTDIEDAKGTDRSRSETINEGESVVFGGVRVYVKNVRVQEVAHVSLIPDVKHEKSEADFTFRIEVEKRTIQLSPDRTKKMIKNLDASIEKWDNIVERLGEVVTGLKGACFATSTVLMIKNMASGISGEAAARTKVMGNYKTRCDTEEQFKGMTATECYNKLAPEIKNSVTAMTASLKSANAIMESVQADNKKDSGGFLGGEHIVNMEKYEKDLRERVKAGGGLVDGKINVSVGGKYVLVPVSELKSTTKVKAVLTWQAALKNGDAATVSSTKAEMDAALRNVALGVEANEKENAASQSIKGVFGSDSSPKFQVAVSKDVKAVSWNGEYLEDYPKISEKISSLTSSASAIKSGDVSLFSGLTAAVVATASTSKQRIQFFNFNGFSYLLFLDGLAGNDRLAVSKAYKMIGDNIAVASEGELTELRKYVFVSVSSNSCSNSWPKGKAEVQYYESGNNVGLPAVVPFGFPGDDLSEGWYAWIGNAGGEFTSDSVQGYKASGDVRNFYICNIGKNQVMENKLGDDQCQNFDANSAGGVKNFGGCDVDALKLYDRAREAIRQASRQTGEDSVDIFGEMIKRGRPLSDLGGFECQDFMSPEDCLLMFNVCDPVICPPSRCDLGGKFPVSDVIASGVIGSLTLCLPNAKEGIKMPVCLSGVHAGLDSYLSILKSEKDCLQHSLDTGEMVGICDQITSVYKCEFFWRQMSPLMDQMIPSLIDYAIHGKKVRGGGEYALVAQSWNTVKKSVSYFKDTYAQNAFRAFNIRSTQEIGSSVCKAFVGTSAPGSASFIEDLLNPESPSQFYAQFSEQLFTEATAPSTSSYKVYYHIYAGNDQGVQYKVYLRDPPATSYYASTPEVDVKSGYIAAGSSADESVDFTAPSGYKELCVVINAKTECGFKQTTSDFGLNMLSKKFVKEQAEDTDITTEKQCISGNPSALSMANLNIQAGAEEVVNPEISLRGIVRVCATSNPETGVAFGESVTCEDGCGTGFKCGDEGVCIDKAGSGTVEKSIGRWEDVGYCGESSMRCWLDVDSVKDDLQAVSDFTGGSNSLLDKRKGLIDNTRLDLKGVAELLSKARDDVKKLSVSKDIETGLKIIGELERVIGNESQAGAGTNGDRAEALALKASVLRVLSGKVGEANVRKGVVARDVGAVKALENSDCDSVCVGDYDGGVLVGSSECGTEGYEFNTDGDVSCCCKKGGAEEVKAIPSLTSFQAGSVEAATNCTDCGKGSQFCREAECDAIADKLEAECQYIEGLFGGVFGGDCVEVEGGAGEKPVGGEKIPQEAMGDCERVFGERIIEIAKEVKKKKGISDASIKSDGVADCFEELALMIAMQESGLRHCDKNVGDCFNCGEDNLLLGSDERSSGIMQIDRDTHIIDYGNFDVNVRYALEKILVDWGYNIYKGGKDFEGINYKGWNAAIRSYNGWGKGGVSDYVEQVLNEKDAIIEKFPGACGVVGTNDVLALQTPGKLPNIEGFNQVVPIYS